MTLARLNMFSIVQQDLDILETVSVFAVCNNQRTVTCPRCKSPSKLIELYDMLLVHGPHFHFVMFFLITAMRTVFMNTNSKLILPLEVIHNRFSVPISLCESATLSPCYG